MQQILKHQWDMERKFIFGMLFLLRVIKLCEKSIKFRTAFMVCVKKKITKKLAFFLLSSKRPYWFRMTEGEKGY